jgi:hypothetical protein
MSVVKKTKEEWEKEGENLFGADRLKWRLECPSCGHIASAEDYRRAGAPISCVGFSCLGRWMEKKNNAFPRKKHGKGCNYAGGGLFQIHPLLVDGHPMFDFAKPDSVTSACKLNPLDEVAHGN